MGAARKGAERYVERGRSKGEVEAGTWGRKRAAAVEVACFLVSSSKVRDLGLAYLPSYSAFLIRALSSSRWTSSSPSRCRFTYRGPGD